MSNLFHNISQPLTNIKPLYAQSPGQRGAAAAYSEGDIISAVIEDKKNGAVTLRVSDDFSFKADAASVRGEVGDTARFKVLKRGKDGLALKQLDERRQSRGADAGMLNKPTEIKEFAKTIRDITDDEQQRAETLEERQRKAAQAVAKIQRAQAYMSGLDEKSAVAALVESGLSLEKISFTLLNRVMHETDMRPARPMSADERERAMAVKFADKSDAPYIADSLYKHGLAVNERNAARLESARAKLPERADDGVIERVISGGEELTPENLYIGRFSSQGGGADNDTDFYAMEDEIRRLFELENIAYDGERREAARFLLARDIPLTFENVEKAVLLKHLGERVSKAAFFDKAAEYIAADKNAADVPLTEIADSPLKARRELAAAQLRAASEAAARLNGREIEINTEPVRETLRTLEEVERERRSAYLRIAGAEADGAQAARMEELFAVIRDTRPLTVNVHHDILYGLRPFTINGAHEAVLAARARDGYEMFETAPDPRYGDSFARVRGQFAPLLENLNITATPDNIKAAVICSKNSMDVNWENIAAVKEIDAKLNAVIDGLHPMVAAQMIKDGLAPLDIHMEQALAYIRQFKEIYGEDGGRRAARHILEMDEDGSVDEDTRKGMVAVYRMLHVIQKDGAAALGLAAKQDAPLTLGGLMELAKYYTKQKRGGAFSKTVDDEFGHLERLDRPEESIRAILERETRPPRTHTDIMAERFLYAAEPGILKQMMEEKENIIIESAVYEPAMLRAEGEGVYDAPAHTAALVNMFCAAQPESLAYLRQLNMPATRGALNALERLRRSPGALPEAIGELLDSEDGDGELAAALDEALPDSGLETLRDGQPPETVFERLLAALDGAELTAAPTRVEAARRLAELRHKLNGERGFQVPIRFNGGVTSLNLYVLNEHAMLNGGARVLLQLDTRSLGTVSGYFTVQDGGVDISFTAETREALAALTAERETLAEMLAEAGLSVNSLRFDAVKARAAEPSPAEYEAEPAVPLSEYEYVV